MAESGFLFRTVDGGDGPRRTVLYVPRGLDRSVPAPCIVFLHGSGECGTDGLRQLAQGLAPAMVAAPEAWPFVAVFPQLETSEIQWADREGLVLAALADARGECAIDPDRIYLTGLSRGGAGTWAIAARHPGVFAAAAPICGYGDPATVAAPLAAMPIWAFHGLADDVVKPEKTTAIVEAIRAAGGTPKMTLYPGVDHGSWDRAYRTEGLGEWFLAHRRAR